MLNRRAIAQIMNVIRCACKMEIKREKNNTNDQIAVKNCCMYVGLWTMSQRSIQKSTGQVIMDLLKTFPYQPFNIYLFQFMDAILFLSNWVHSSAFLHFCMYAPNVQLKHTFHRHRDLHQNITPTKLCIAPLTTSYSKQSVIKSAEIGSANAIYGATSKPSYKISPK